MGPSHNVLSFLSLSFHNNRRRRRLCGGLGVGFGFRGRGGFARRVGGAADGRWKSVLRVACDPDDAVGAACGSKWRRTWVVREERRAGGPAREAVEAEVAAGETAGLERLVQHVDHSRNNSNCVCHGDRRSPSRLGTAGG